MNEQIPEQNVFTMNMNEQALFGNVGYSLLICFEMFKGKQVKTL